MCISIITYNSKNEEKDIGVTAYIIHFVIVIAFNIIILIKEKEISPDRFHKHILLNNMLYHKDPYSLFL